MKQTGGEGCTLTPQGYTGAKPDGALNPRPPTRPPPAREVQPVAKQPHHMGSHARRSAAVRAAAYANPSTPCARCGRTLDQHPPTKAGNPPTWSGGHATDGEVNGLLLPEVLSCNSRAGARLGHKPRGPLAW